MFLAVKTPIVASCFGNWSSKQQIIYINGCKYTFMDNTIVSRKETIPAIKKRCVLRGLKQSTTEQYVRAYKRYSDTFGGLLEQEHVETFLTERQGAENTTLSRAMIAMVSYIQEVPIEIPKLKEQGRKIPKYLNKDTVNALISSVDEDYRLCIHLMWECGLRVSEAIKLRYDDIEGDYIRIEDSKGAPRIVYPSPKLIEAIKATRTSPEQKYVFRSPHSASGHVSAKTINRRIKEVDEELHAHILRHSFATHIYGATNDVLAVKELLGHKNLETTSVYTHISNQKALEANKKIYE